MSCDHEGQASVQVLMDDHLASGQGMAPLGMLQLHDEVVKEYGVVLVNGAFESLNEEYLRDLPTVQCIPGETMQSRPQLRRA